eukprot:Blabericola_migrator_1__172@NODE_1045_length_5616_cov_254_394125_g719_i0_p1_GENE_NODE_1045_length_5616_cov_254_394125_g719_i0NODE_1045_length_5616_cov_254_394125_g719_i0_p1_ORF_typecomplete_len1112_score264_02Importin_rep_4/PF18808_1/1_8e03Importin_rep_4/PF18808_1/5_2e03Importin_rep_4/PF18808_1/1_7e21Importin_rep_4/PF18808_1/2_2e02Vac14_Fab1_bd/PF12755_7/1_7e03Vac14_Fab1_bd/PF12755_7/4_5e02Vac14_Fab1_bd/PF12755_7/13Vac14_Fab1_bd/PF12755_7/4_3e11Vac14_Fab1_bd/PF12755_7/0_0018Vac14_Fab1_bd/PF12755
MSAPVDITFIRNILDQSISVDKNARTQATDAFTNLKQAQPNALITLLIEILATDPDVQRRQQAAIAIRTALREFLNVQEENVWLALNEETRTLFKTQLLNLIVSEREKLVRDSIADIVSDVGDLLIPAKKWSELPDAIMTMLACNDNVDVQIVGMNLCGNLEGHVSDKLVAHMKDLAKMLGERLTQNNPVLQIAVVELVAQIVTKEPREMWRPLEALLPAISQSLVTLAQLDDDIHINAMLQALVEAAEGAAEYYKGGMDQMVTVLLAICANAELDDKIRQLAMEVLLTLASNRPKMVQRMPNFVSLVVHQLMVFMLSTESDAEWHARELVTDDKDEPAIEEVGEYGLDRLAGSIGGEVAMPIIFQHVATFLNEQSWTHKVAALMTISQTIEYLPEEKVEEQLGEIVDLLLKETQNDNCRVRFAACRALGQLALDHKPYVQQNHYQTILPALLTLFSDVVPRVQSQALAAFTNFAEDVQLEDLRPYVADIMNKVMSLLSTPLTPQQQAAVTPVVCEKQSRCIREQCITCVAVVAGVLGKEFIPHCSTIVPLMQEIAANANTVESRQLQGRAFECITIIAYVVELEGIQGSLEGVVRDLLMLYATEMEAGDPRIEYVQEALRRLIRVLGGHFAPFLPNVLPKIFESLAVSDDVNDNLEDLDGKDYTMICLASGNLSCVKTSKLDDMEKHLEVLSAIIESMKEEYAPQAAPTVERLLPLLDYQLTDKIKILILNCFAELLKFAATRPDLRELAKRTLLGSIKSIMASAADEETIVIVGVIEVASYLGALAKCIRAAGPGMLEPNEITDIVGKGFELIKASGERRATVAAALLQETDEEDQERLENDADEEETLSEKVMDVFTSIMTHHPESFVGTCGERYAQFIQAQLESRDQYDRNLAFNGCCDLLCELGVTGLDICKPFLGQLTLAITDSNIVARTAACYAMSLAIVLPNFDGSASSEIVPRLILLLRDSSASEKSNLAATDNATSALVAYILNRPQDLGDDLQNVVDLCVSHLPLKQDEEEGRKVHKLIIGHLQQETSLFYGPNNAHLDKLIKMVCEIYRTDFSDDEIDESIKQLIRKIGVQVLVASSNKTDLTNSQKRGLKKLAHDISN